MNDQNLMETIALMALVTAAPRVLPLTLLGNIHFPRFIEKSLKYVPVSILSAFLASEILFKGNQLVEPSSNIHLWVCVLAFVAAFATRSLLFTVVLGVFATACIRGFLF